MCHYWAFVLEKKLVIAQCLIIYKNAIKIMYIINPSMILNQIKDNQKHESSHKRVLY